MIKASNFKIRRRLLLFILPTAAFIYIITVLQISFNFRRAALQNAIAVTQSETARYANEVKNTMDIYMNGARFLSQTFAGYNEFPESYRRLVLSKILYNQLSSNQNFLATWAICEPNTIDSLDKNFINTPGSTRLGNFAYTYYKDQDDIALELTSAEGELFAGDYYTVPKRTLKETVMDVYFYSYTGRKEDEILQTSLIVPILYANKFIGVTGVDAKVDIFQELVENIVPFKGSFAFLMSNNGYIVAHHDFNAINHSITEQYSNFKESDSIVHKINYGESFTANYKDSSLKSEFLFSFKPVKIGNSSSPWSLAIAIPLDVIYEKSNREFVVSLIISFLGLILLTIVIYILSGSISKPLVTIAGLLKMLNKADLTQIRYIAKHRKDEVGEIAYSAAILINWLNTTAVFAREIGNGNLDAQYCLFSDDDDLGHALTEMRMKLRSAKDADEKYRKESQIRNWIAEGSAKFAEIVQINQNDRDEFAYQVVSNLIKYLNANQGGMFVLVDDHSGKSFLELKGAYAYNRRKFLKKKIGITESLVGQCFMEEQMILLSNIPNDYIQITSGLGGSNPTYLLLIPLKNRDGKFGVIEIASFHIFEHHHLDLIMKIADTIASSLANMRNAELMRKLLEDSDYKSEQMSMQEEEMRQSIEMLMENLKEAQISEENLKRELQVAQNFIEQLQAKTK